MTGTRVVMDPRIEERRHEVQRLISRRRLRVSLAIASVFVVIGLAYLVVESPLLDVDQVQVVGTHHVGADAVRAAAHVHVGDALLRIDTGSVARRVERLSWVARARVQRRLPGTLRITVTEYEAVAYVRAPDGRVALVAADDRVIALARTPEPGAIEIRGVRNLPAIGALLSPGGAANVVRRLPGALAQRVTAVDIGGDGIALALARGGEVRLGTLDALGSKGAVALAVLDNLGTTRFAYVDVSEPGSPVVR